MSDPRVALGPSLGLDAESPVVDALDRLRPVVRVAAGAPATVLTAAATLYSLLVRVHPHTSLDGDGLLDRNPWGAASLSQLPDIMLPSRPDPSRLPDTTFTIAVGAGAEFADLWVGGNDWTAHMGSSPRPAGGRSGLGLQAGVIFAAAEAMKIALGTGMIHVRVGAELVWNLLDYRCTVGGDVPAPAGRLEVAFFGSGSVGSSAIGILAMQPALTGDATVVDPDTYDPERNPFRYPASTGRELGQKASWTSDLLQSAGWRTEAVQSDVAGWVTSRRSPGFGGVAVSSVDSLSGRLQVADALAATTLSVGVGGTALHVQREHPSDAAACPYCDFVSMASPLSQAQLQAEMTGLSVERVAALRLSDLPLTSEDVARAVAAGRVRQDRTGELIGRRFDDLVRRVYAEVLVTTPAGSAAVSTPFVSWMGGLLIVAELAKAALGLPMIDRRVDLDLAGVPLGAVGRRSRDPTGRCVCHSPQRRRWVAKMYGGG